MINRDKTKDDKNFNCSQTHETSYVAGLYPGSEKKVTAFLTSACEARTLQNATHREVYDLIHKKLDLPIPPAK